MNLEEMLNPEQCEAVIHKNGPLLIFAGAGSGKTRVITYRIYYLITNYKVNPANILAVTFTNKAADEMKRRVEDLFKNNIKLWIGTFHSIGARILRLFHGEIGLEKNFVIYDDDDQQKVIKECIAELKQDEKLFPKKVIQFLINKMKQEAQKSPDKYLTSAYVERKQMINEIIKLYDKKLIKNNALDFGDLLLKTVQLLEKCPSVREYFQNKFRYVLVDEFQDTNKIQYELLKYLAAPQNNICVVGDDDQSIYKWRGADITNILNFNKDYNDAKVIKLVRNYRCTKNIISAANSVIKNNKVRAEKKLLTENDLGDPILAITLPDEINEALSVAKTINEEQNNKIRLNEIAVFYRVHAQSRVIEETLRKFRIPYKIVGGIKFYERAEIKDIIAYLKVVHNPSDQVSLKRIINTPSRGIGDVTVEKLINKAETNNKTLWEIMVDLSNQNSDLKVPTNILNFVKLMQKWMEMNSNTQPSIIAQTIIKDINYEEYLKSSHPNEAVSKIQNIEEFVGSIISFEKFNDNPSLEDFLLKNSLISDVDQYDDKKDGVVLMTVHSAKGLEFDVVLIVGMEEELFPYPASEEDEEPEEKIEEERRLFYVALTRAKKRIYLFNTVSRTLFGRTRRKNLPSKFLIEIPQKHKVEVGNYLFNQNERDDNYSSSNYYNSRYSGSNKTGYSSSNKKDKIFFRKKSEVSISNDKLIETPSISSQNNNTNSRKSEFIQGAMVMHPKFGQGRIISIKDGESKIITVHFPKYGTKNIVSNFLSLIN